MEDNFDLSKLRSKPKRKNSRAKGAAFENKVAKILNERFDTKEFARTPGSGAFATTHTLPKHLQIQGDLITPQTFAYIIECKKGYNDLGIHSMLDFQSKLWEWIEHMERDAAAAEKAPILFMAQDRQPIISILEYKEEIINYTDSYSTLTSKEGIEYIMLYMDDLLKIHNGFFFIQD